jgi:hypothetical protein
VHDRRVNGETFVFGNQGGLFMNAMTWWDHTTNSVWSQPWGRAIAGPLKGTELELIPSQLVPWKTWRDMHPNTLALDTQAMSVFPGASAREQFYPGYVIGITLGESATAFPYELASEAELINEAVGPHPVVVYVNSEIRSVHAYLRQVDDQTLTFARQDGAVRDLETGSSWQMDRGVAIDGPLRGQALRVVPYIPAYRSAWHDFYPDSRWYQGEP